MTSLLKSLILAMVVATTATAARAEPLAAGLEAQGTTRAPIGWVDFCDRHPDECRGPALAAEMVVLSKRTRKLIETINRTINHRIRPVSDLDHHGTLERWSYPDDGKGDCEDYVLEKRRQLIAAGLPRQALLITVVRDLKGDGHSVLTVVTDKGDLVLDNQEPDVTPWSETGYRFVKRQSAEHPDRWVSLGGIETAQSVATLLRRR